MQRLFGDVQAIAGFGQCSHKHSTAAAYRQPLGSTIYEGDMLKSFLLIIALAVLTISGSFPQQALPVFVGTVVDPEDENFVGDSTAVGQYLDTFDAVIAPIQKVASSELPPTNGISYAAENAYDWNLTTAWVPRRSNNGIGEWLQYTYDRGPDERFALTSLIVFNGYRKSRKLWEANARVREMKLDLNGKPYAVIRLRDSYNYQTVPLGKIHLNAKKTVLRFQIISVYKGSKYPDVAISELEFDGEGAY
jgi:hypothetical protein